jgi:hypothetical protein
MLPIDYHVQSALYKFNREMRRLNQGRQTENRCLMKPAVKRIAAVLLVSIILSACASDHNNQYQAPEHPKVRHYPTTGIVFS